MNDFVNGAFSVVGAALLLGTLALLATQWAKAIWEEFKKVFAKKEDEQ